ncbi:DUF397 domain-containing protein [Streptomyces sp. NBC_01190]|uniref:DUF397 domain-containing protein n=1 Tax=Streptomyces sp. NBC_01190 TaxID=2903767 RepID=UPI00386A4E7B|nr:DUF397 domain-containing protein [Streptomyces sp. NBC_01190]
MMDDTSQGMDWHKSSYSNSSGGECVEVGRWRKSSYSGSQGGECVEVADGVPGVVPVRDSKDPEGPALRFTPASWTAFMADVKSGRFPT